MSKLVEDMLVNCRSLHKLGRVVFSLSHADPAFEKILNQLLLRYEDEGLDGGLVHNVQLGCEVDLDSVLNRLVEMHAGCIRINAASLLSPDGRKVLIAGGHDSGKTTLALGLVFGHGWKVITEHCTLLDTAQNEIVSFASPFRLKKGMRDVLAGIAGIPPQFVLHDFLPLLAENVAETCSGPFDLAVYLDANLATEFSCSPLSIATYQRNLLSISNLATLPNSMQKFASFLADDGCYLFTGGSLEQRIEELLKISARVMADVPAGKGPEVSRSVARSTERELFIRPSRENRQLDDIRQEPCFSWFSKSLLPRQASLVTKAGLQDDLLVSIMGPAGGMKMPAGQIYGGLLSISSGPTPIVRVIDRLPASGIWIDDRSFVRSVYSQQMVLHHHRRDRLTVITSAECEYVHDVRLQFGQLLVVSTGTNEVVQFSLAGELLRRWKFPGRAGSRHMNCLDFWNGRYVVSCFGRFDEPVDPQKRGEGAGIIFDLETDETVWDGLYFPHTPRMDNGQQFICDSGTSRLLIRDCNGGSIKELHFPNAFTRGLAFGNKNIYVGLSGFRDAVRGKVVSSIPNARIAVLDRATFELIDEVDLPGLEVYDIAVVRHDNHETFDGCTEFSL